MTRNKSSFKKRLKEAVIRKEIRFGPARVIASGYNADSFCVSSSFVFYLFLVSLGLKKVNAVR